MSSTRHSTLTTHPRTEQDTPQDDRAAYEELAPLFDVLADDSVPEPRRDDVRETLVTGHLPVAQHIAHRFRGKGQPADDLEQVATVGLINAVDRFDPHRGTDFLSFAVPTITGEVRKHFRDTGWSVRVPRRLQELHQSINQAVADLGNELGRAPKPSEIARRLNLPIAEVRQGLEVANAYNAEPLPTAGDPREDDPGPTRDRIGVEDRGLIDVEDRVTLYPALEQLPEREREIVVMRFFGNMTQTQIARRMGISQMHVSRLLARSFDQLREILTQQTSPESVSAPELRGTSSVPVDGRHDDRSGTWREDSRS